MKQLFLQLIFTLVISVFSINPSFCLEGTVRDRIHQNHVHRKSVTIGVLLTHFSTIQNNNEPDYNIRFINPGGEVLFHYSLNNSTSLVTGFSYQCNKITLVENSFDLGTTINDISIPLLISLKPFQSKIPNMEFSAGFYLGQYVIISNNIRSNQNERNYAKLFSADDFIGDIYVAISKKSILKKIPIGMDLFYRYRLKEHQIVNHYVSQSFYGIKLKYGFNL